MTLSEENQKRTAHAQAAEFLHRIRDRMGPDQVVRDCFTRAEVQAIFDEVVGCDPDAVDRVRRVLAGES